MKILYGVQATGNGHINRSREVIRELKKAGHEVNVIFSGRAHDLFWDIDEFSPYEIYKGLTFSVKNGRINYLESAFKLNIMRFYQDIFQYTKNGFDLVITDFEPISSRIAIKKKIPCVGIGHQYAFHYNIPVNKGDVVARGVLKYFAPCDYPVGLHWHHYNQPVLPPIVPYMEEKQKIGNKILVYLPFENQQSIVDIFKEFGGFDFFIYTGIPRENDNMNIHLRPFSRNKFLDDLCDCGGVICNAGFELPSEALSLNKKVLVKPVRGQMEQKCNSIALKELNLGEYMNILDRGIIAGWLANNSYSCLRYPDVAAKIAAWIGKKNWSDIASLSQSIWDHAESEKRIKLY